MTADENRQMRERVHHAQRELWRVHDSIADMHSNDPKLMRADKRIGTILAKIEELAEIVRSMEVTV